MITGESANTSYWVILFDKESGVYTFHVEMEDPGSGVEKSRIHKRNVEEVHPTGTGRCGVKDDV